MGREIEPFLSGRGWKKAACVGWMDFQPRIDNNCLNQPRAGPFLAPAPRHSRALPTAGDGEEGGFERNERQRSIPFVESRARAWRIYDPCHCLYSETPLHALSLSLLYSPLEASSIHDYSRYIHSRYSELFILLQLYYLWLEREEERLSRSTNRDELAIPASFRSHYSPSTCRFRLEKYNIHDWDRNDFCNYVVVEGCNDN